MRVRFWTCLIWALGVCGAQASERADFTTGEGTNGWTISVAEYVSPTYASAVDRISLSYSGAADGSATVSAIANGGGESSVATISAAATAATFDFPETTDFRAFRIAAQNGWTLTSFSAEVSSATLDAPGDVTISNNITGTSFDAYWNPVAGATGYKVYVWTNATVGASTGMQVWEETFANSPAKSSSTAFDVSSTDSGVADWRFDKVYAHSEAGMVRIGNTSAKGVLISPEVGDEVATGENMALRITAWRQATSDGTDMPIGVVSDGVTNIVGVIVLGDVRDTYHVALPSFNVGDRVALFSPTNKSSARAIIDDVAILSGYSEGHLEPSYIVDGRDVGDSLSYTLDNLPSVPVQVAVAAYGRRGVVSVKTATQVVDLSNPDKVSMLNACPMSSLTDWAYVQDFDSLAGDATNWLNGTTLQYWQAWRGSAAAVRITHNTGTASSGGLYALASDVKSNARAFGGLTTKTDVLTWGMAFTNDTESVISLSSVAYSAQQWGTRNSEAHPLKLSYLVADELRWMSEETEGWVDCLSTESDGTKPEVPVSTSESWSPTSNVKINPRQVLYLKWTVVPPINGSAAMMAIDDLTVTFTSAFRSFVIHLVDRGK